MSDDPLTDTFHEFLYALIMAAIVVGILLPLCVGLTIFLAGRL